MKSTLRIRKVDNRVKEEHIKNCTNAISHITLRRELKALPSLTSLWTRLENPEDILLHLWIVLKV